MSHLYEISFEGYFYGNRIAKKLSFVNKNYAQKENKEFVCFIDAHSIVIFLVLGV